MKPIVVGMNEVNISTEEQPIIGTNALGPCVGVLIHSQKQQKSVVFHTSVDWQPLVVESLIMLAESGLISPENFDKAIKSLNLHEKYRLYEFDSQLKNKLLTKKGLCISEVEETLEVTIIPGYYPDNYHVALNMTKFFASLYPLAKIRMNPLPKKAVRTQMVEKMGSHEFFFDSKSGKFVTEKVVEQGNNITYRI